MQIFEALADCRTVGLLVFSWRKNLTKIWVDTIFEHFPAVFHFTSNLRRNPKVWITCSKQQGLHKSLHRWCVREFSLRRVFISGSQSIDFQFFVLRVSPLHPLPPPVFFFPVLRFFLLSLVHGKCMPEPTWLAQRLHPQPQPLLAFFCSKSFPIFLALKNFLKCNLTPLWQTHETLFCGTFGSNFLQFI